jgi:DNA-binding NarL/FixJ family response regulator
MPVRIVFAEDNYLVREGTAALLAEVGEIELVASVGDLAGLLAAVEQHAPSAVLTDIRMPPTNTTEGSTPHGASAPSTPTSAWWSCPSTPKRIMRTNC